MKCGLHISGHVELLDTKNKTFLFAIMISVKENERVYLLSPFQNVPYSKIVDLGSSGEEKTKLLS